VSVPELEAGEGSEAGRGPREGKGGEGKDFAIVATLSAVVPTGEEVIEVLGQTRE